MCLLVEEGTTTSDIFLPAPQIERDSDQDFRNNFSFILNIGHRGAC